MFGREPTLVLAFIRAILVCATLFGLTLSEAQFAAIYLVFETGLALVNRSQVVPDKEGSRRL